MSTHALARGRAECCFTTGTAVVGLELLHLWQLASYRNQMFALTIRSMSVKAMLRQPKAPNCGWEKKPSCYCRGRILESAEYASIDWFVRPDSRLLQCCAN